MSADDIIAQLITMPPKRMSELEAIIGPVNMSFAREDAENTGFLVRPRIPKVGTPPPGDFTDEFPRLSVTYHFDMDHERPERQRDVKLKSYSLVVRGERSTTETRLLQKFGTPKKATQPTKYATTVWANYHPFYVAAGAEGTYKLDWYEERPEWSFDTPEPDARRAWLKGLCTTIQRAHSIDEIDMYCKAKSGGAAGVDILGSYNSGLNPNASFKFPLDDARDYWLRFSPRFRAMMVADVFGWTPAIGYSGDVHQSTWAIQGRDADWYPISGALEQWELHATLAGRPTGEERPARGTCIPRMLSHKDEVESLSIRPRFR